jgi:rRNA maturation endonuclease Nob1
MSDREAKPYHHEISIEETDGPIDWASALKELEKSAPAPRDADRAPISTVKSSTQVPVEAGESEQNRPAPDSRSKYRELASKRAVKISTEDLKTLDELADILASVNIANSLLDGFIRQHPEAVSPRLIENWRHNLKETSQIMMREFHQLRNGKENKVYDPRNVCTVCHTVYLSPLPDGVCDQCRANTGSRAEGAY